MQKLLRTLRFDSSDVSVFGVAAAERECAVSCAFQFCDLQWEELDGKTRQAFNNGFLGLASFGYSTFASVCEISDSALAETEMVFARYILENFAAPDFQSSLDAAREEIGYALQLCQDVPENTVFAVRREFSMDGRIKESFHTIEVEENGRAGGSVWTEIDDKQGD
ncbi:MAG: hypothetical protein GY789_30385 [Hyphomicrobiales bacterium]|nr:hypothetical protein [Hyphomicrobiales bacterium]MCP5002239.1 hypothetical protein [Hyphomicrobiales bacterium]